MSDPTSFTEVVVREGGSYWAYCREFPGCIAVGKTRAELNRNFTEVFEGYLEAPTIWAGSKSV